MIRVQKNRPAIAMIELIFALVIIGITLMSAPMLISTSTQSGYVAIQQEGISQAASRVNMIMSGYFWDEKNTQDDAAYTIMMTDSSSIDLNESADPLFPGWRAGTPKESQRNFRIEGSNARLYASALGLDTGDTEEDDIDDFHGKPPIHLQLASGATGTGPNYIEKTTVDIGTVISYGFDTVTGGYQQNSIDFQPFSSAPSGKTSNIKNIEVTLTSSSTLKELNKTIVMKAFSCNIGGFKLEERDF